MEYAVSVVLTTKNRVESLKNAIQSVFSQVFTNYELIVVNDCSDDGTEEFLMSLSMENIKVINLKKGESAGGNYARNIGIRAAEGKYIGLLDDDDIWYSNKLSLQINLLEESPESAFAYCGIKRVIDHSLFIEKLPKYKGDLSNIIFKEMVCLTSTFFCEKQLLVKAGLFDENLTHWQDYELCMRLFQLTKVTYVPQILVDINVDTKNMKRLSNQYHNWVKAVEYIRKKHEKIICSSDAQFEFENLIIEDAANRKYLDGDRKGHRKKMLILWIRKKHVKYLIRGIFNLSSNDIQKLKGRKVKKSDERNRSN